jgi:uncharacterized protein (DUF927 family)
VHACSGVSRQAAPRLNEQKPVKKPPKRGPKKAAKPVPTARSTPERNSRIGRPARSIDFAAIKARAEPLIVEILEELAPEGELRGSEYFMLNPHRNDGSLGSFKYNVDKNVFEDFADDDVKGNDIIALTAFLQDITQLAAARKVLEIIERLESEGKATPESGRPTSKATPRRKRMPSKPPSAAIVPIPSNAPAPPSEHPLLGKPSACYLYNDASGRTVSLIYRFDPPGEDKTIRPLTFRRDEVGKYLWDWLGLDDARPLYNLYELAQRPDAPVLIVEGEKAADAAKRLCPEFVAVTTMNGAKSPEKSDLTPLHGRSVLIWPDYDEAGRSYALQIRSLLKAASPEAHVDILKPLQCRPGKADDGQPTLEPGFTPEAGFDAADALSMGWTAAHVQFLGVGTNPDLLEPEPVQEDTAEDEETAEQVVVGDNFLVRPDGVFQIRYKEGQQYEIKVSSKIEVLAQSLDETGRWGYLLRLTDPDGAEVEWAMPREILSSPSNLRAELLSRGADVYPGGDHDPLYDYLLSAKPPNRVRCTAKPGWNQDTAGKPVFVLPGRVVGETNDRVILQGSSHDAEKTFGSQGSLADWQANVGALCVGNSRLVMAVCAALAGPVLHLMNEENGGFHFVGASSMGKTTAVELAASVWGHRGHFVKTWRTTSNALESIAVRHNDTLLILDEISQVDAREAGDVAYMLGNGKGKARANKSADLRAISSWRLLFLSTGERSLTEHMESGAKRSMVGQEVRLVNITADAGQGMGLFENLHGTETPQGFAGRIKGITAEYYGVAGPAFVEKLMEQGTGTALVEDISRGITQFVATSVPADASGQVHRVGRRFGILAAVGEAAIAAGILPWPAGEAVTGARSCFQTWLDNRGGAGNQEAEQAVTQVRQFLELHGASRFTNWDQREDDFSNSTTFNRAGFKKLNPDDEFEYYVLPEAFRTEVCAGLNPKQVTQALLAKGFLELGTDGKPQKQVRLPGMTSTRVYVIKSSILRGD